MTEPDERSPPDVITSDTDNRTQIHPSDAPPGKRAKFDRLRAYNRGTWNGPKRENKELIREQDNLHRYDAIASKLLLRPQRKRGRRLFCELDHESFGIEVDKTIFAVCVLVANRDVPDGVRHYPNASAPSDDQFADLQADIFEHRGEACSAVEKVRSALDLCPS